MIQELFARYSWLGVMALVIAFTAFAGILLQLLVERRSPRWGHDARLPLDEAPPADAPHETHREPQETAR